MQCADKKTASQSVTVEKSYTMSEKVQRTYRYAELTWPEADEAAKQNKVVVLPIGSMEQHGPHLPLDYDYYIADRCCLEAGKRSPADILVLPPIPFGYNIQGVDFPGTIHVEYNHLLEYCLDVCKSLAYHGFKKILIINGHGSNWPILDLVARRVVIETSSYCSVANWFAFGKEAFQKVRESVYPGGCAHACEAETSVYLYLNPELVQMDKAQDYLRENLDKFYQVDLFGGAAKVWYGYWLSSDTPNGCIGQPTLATADKGRVLFEGAVSGMVEFIRKFRAMDLPQRHDHHSMHKNERKVLGWP